MILASSLVLVRESICPPVESCPNQNLFQKFLKYNSITMATHMSERYSCTNLRVASTWLITSNIACPTRGTNLDSMQLCPAAHQPSSLIMSTPIFCVPTQCKQQDIIAQSVCGSCSNNSDIVQWHHLHVSSFAGNMGPSICQTP